MNNEEMNISGALRETEAPRGASWWPKAMEAKQYFFTYRDGLTADVLRRGGVPHKTIFGLQVPQLGALARQLDGVAGDERKGLAAWLWADRDVRESRLLACWLFDKGMDCEEALELCRDVRSSEEADILTFRLLRFLPFSDRLLAAISEEGNHPEIEKALRRTQG